MRYSRVEADAVSYNSAMGACMKAGLQHHVPDLFHQLCAVQVPPDLVTFNTMIRACGSHWQKVCALLQDLEASSLEPDLVTYSSAISVFERQGHWEQVLGLLEELSVNKVETDRILWNSVVSACAKGSEWEHATGALETLLPASVRADIITYNAAINGLGKAGEWELAHLRLLELKATMCQANLVTFNAVINSHQERQKWPEAWRLLEVVAEAGLEADVISFNSALSGGSGGSGPWKGILSKFEDLRRGRQGLQVDAVTMSSVMVSGSHWHLAVSFLSLCGSMALEGNAVLCNAALSTCSHTGLWQQGLSILRSLPKTGIQPDLRHLQRCAQRLRGL